MKITAHFFLSLLLISSFGLFAQDDKAKGILDKLSSNTKSYSSMQADFDYRLTGEGMNEKQSGSLKTKGNKYYLVIAGQHVVSDGKNVWTILEDAEEVQLNAVSENEDNEEYISPTNILTLWEKGFKYKYDKAGTVGDTPVDIINLYPENPEEKSFHTIKLYVNKNATQVEQIEIKGKDGIDYTYTIKKFTANGSLNDKEFTLNKQKFGEFDVIDLR
jgi:outer membrane lipoprotein-sorting protein